ncbi:hypothetical protein ACLB2K_029281 [Fragaria x ananassa]
MQFKVSHIYREGFTVADALASYGVLNAGYKWWEEIPDFIFRQFGRDLFAATVYRSGRVVFLSCIPSVTGETLLGEALQSFKSAKRSRKFKTARQKVQGHEAQKVQGREAQKVQGREEQKVQGREAERKFKTARQK